MTAAFHNDPALKAKALADAEAQGHPGWEITATPEQREALAAAYGLSPGFLSLIISPRSMTPREVFVREALGFIEPGADLDAIVRGWLLAVWSNPVDGPAVKLRDSPAYEAAAAIIRLVEAQGSSPVSRQAWRHARNALIGVQGMSPEQAAYATVVTSMAWDPETTSTLAGDVWIAWERAAMEGQGLPHGWSKDREDLLMEAVRACHRQTFEIIGEGPQEEAAARAHEERRAALYDACLLERGLTEEWEAFGVYADTVMRPFAMAWYPRALETVREVCREARVTA